LIKAIGVTVNKNNRQYMKNITFYLSFFLWFNAYAGGNLPNMTYSDHHKDDADFAALILVLEKRTSKISSICQALAKLDEKYQESDSKIKSLMHKNGLGTESEGESTVDEELQSANGTTREDNLEGAQSNFSENSHENNKDTESDTSPKVTKKRSRLPQECDICHKILANRHSLQVHYRSHTKEKPYECGYCETAFSTGGNRNVHEKNVHGKHRKHRKNS
jgi:hypothetical protein